MQDEAQSLRLTGEGSVQVTCTQAPHPLRGSPASRGLVLLRDAK